MMNVWKLPVFFGLFLLAGLAALSAQGPREVQERMRERLPEIDGLKREQLVGENNEGFLEARGRLDSRQQALVREENADRKTVYETIGEQTRTSAEQVGKVRARQIAQRSAKGVLVENERGEWVEKR